MVKGLIFDLDGVITETSAAHFQAWKKLAKDIGINVNDDIEDKVRGISRMDSLELILKDNGVLDKYSQKQKEEMAAKKNDIYQTLIVNLKPKDTFPGIRELWVEAKTKGIKIGIASASRNAPKILKALELMEMVDYISDPQSVAKGKPAPDIFLDCAKGLGITVDQSIGFEDAAAGVDGILAANMFCVGIGNPTIVKKAHIIFEDTADLTLEKVLKAKGDN